MFNLQAIYCQLNLQVKGLNGYGLMSYGRYPKHFRTTTIDHSNKPCFVTDRRTEPDLYCVSAQRLTQAHRGHIILTASLLVVTLSLKYRVVVGEAMATIWRDSTEGRTQGFL